MAIQFLNTATAITEAAGDNSTKIATTAYADAAAGAVPIGNYLPLVGGTLTGNLTISVPDGGSSPAMTNTLFMKGYEGRGIGMKIRDSANSATSPSNREWFVGSGYSNSGFNIGYSATGSASSYSAQSKFNITTGGVVTIPGNVGIGTTSPSQKLQVSGSGTQRIYVTETSGGTNTALKSTSSAGYVGTDSTDPFYIQTDSSTRIAIDTSGNVGIGTTSPDAKLDIEAAINPTIRLTNSTNPLGAADVGTLEFFTKDASTGAARVISSIVCVNEADSPSVPDGQLAFKTSLGGANAQPATEKMRIDPVGNVGIGATAPGALLQVGGTTNSNGSSGSFNIAGATGVDSWARAYVVSNTNILSILQANNTALQNGGAYRVTGHIDGTGTDQSSRAVFWNQNGTWYCNLTSASGTNSNNILFLVDATTGLPSVKTYHSSNYTVRVWHERINLNEAGGTDNSRHYFGADAYMTQISNDISMFTSYSGNNTSGNLGIGTASPSAKLEVRSSATTAETIAQFGNGNIQGGLKIKTNGNLEWGLETLNARSLTFGTNNTERMRITSGGNVGIGTTSPSEKLDVSGAVLANAFRTDVNTSDYSVISRSSAGNAPLYVQSADSGTNQPIAKFFYGNTAPNQGSIVLNVAKNSTYFSNTNVGIGTTSPNAKLEIEGDATGDDTPQLIVASGGVDNNAIIHFTDDEGGQVNAIGALEGNVLTLASLNELVFKTDTSSILGNADTKMTILTNGNVGIGTITPNALLHVGGNATLPSGYTGIKSILEGGTFFNIKAEDDKTFAIWSEAVGEAILEINTNENYFLLDPSANIELKVGIGTASPSETLEVTGNVKADSYINQRVSWNTSFTHSSNNTSSFYYIPTNNTQERDINLYWNNWIAQYGGRVKKVIMRNTGSSTVPTATTIRYKVTVNGTDVFTSAVLSITGTGNDKKSSYTFTDTDATFNEGDRVQVSFNTNGNLYYTAVGISLEYTE